MPPSTKYKFSRSLLLSFSSPIIHFFTGTEIKSNYLIKHMTLYDDRVEITLNSPQMGSPEKSQGFPLFISQKYKIQHYHIEMYATIEI